MKAVDASSLTVIGVRHHSPACARLVRRTVEAMRPAAVLIEGPSDFNPHIGDLRAPHALPVAIFSFASGPSGSRSSYAPFCAFSPEWQALQAAWAIGADPLFCDLPSWDPAFGGGENRYADPHRLHERHRGAGAALERELGAEGQDAVWDVLAEAAEDRELPERLNRYFDLVRPPGTPDPAEAARESFMGRMAAWAVAAAGGRPVVLVCGGWHADAVRRAAADADGAEPPRPEAPEGLRTGSYLVPFSDPRLDRFSGYAAGMPSPGYYGRLFEAGLDAAADWAETTVAASLRAAGQVVSTADRIAWRAQAGGLARLRGHAGVLRADLLDGALSTLAKEALDTPPAWTGAGGDGCDPLVRVLLRALAGDREGRLAPGTRQPPLAEDVAERMRAVDVAPAGSPRRVSVDWHEAADRPRAHVLHRLLLLDLPGIAREAGPEGLDRGRLVEVFTVAAHRGWPGAVIEASRWGGTLQMAAAARLAERAAAAETEALADALADALFAGLLGQAPEIVARLANGIGAGRDILALGRAGRRIARVYRFGDAFDAASRAELGRLCGAVFARSLWLLEGVASAREGIDSVDAVLVCRDLARDCPGLPLDRAAAAALFARRAADPATPPGLAGAALGWLVACGDAAATAADVAGRVKRFGLPDQLGDFLAGLFALAREELTAGEDALGAVDGLVAAWDDEAFLRALPALRLAFAWFPPRERERLARTVLRRGGHGAGSAEAQALAWMRQPAPVLDQAAALALEARVAARLARDILLD